jgi:hypothetical protein
MQIILLIPLSKFDFVMVISILMPRKQVCEQITRICKVVSQTGLLVTSRVLSFIA